MGMGIAANLAAQAHLGIESRGILGLVALLTRRRNRQWQSFNRRQTAAGGEIRARAFVAWLRLNGGIRPSQSSCAIESIIYGQSPPACWRPAKRRECRRRATAYVDPETDAGTVLVKRRLNVGANHRASIGGAVRPSIFGERYGSG